jgi:ATP-binding cassette subfamily F protein uup
MEEKILAAEAELEACQVAVGDPAVASRADALAARYRELQAAQEQVDRLYERWAELEARGGSSRK